MTNTPAVREAGFRPDIQGLRAIAVGIVVVYHAGLPQLSGGYIGVDVFFVISGFLISSHLLRGLGKTGRVNFREFYSRRARRILPASFTVLIGTIVAAVFLASPLRLGTFLQDGIATALYVPNMYFAWLQTDYLSDASPSPFQHYWSLGVEEQFYLLWPLLLMLVFLIPLRWRWQRFAVVAVIVLASFIGCVLLARTSQPWAFFSLPTRAWELGIGGLVAFTATQLGRLHIAAAAVLTWVGLGAIAYSALTFTADTQYPGKLTLIPVLGAALFIGFGEAAGKFGPVAFLRWAPFQWLGAISYSLYLVHWPILVLAAARSDMGVQLRYNLLLAAAAVPIAWLLYRFIETPLRYRKSERPTPPGRPLWIAGAVSLGLVGVFLVGGPAVAALPMSTGTSASNGPLETSPAGTTYVPSNIAPTLAGAINDFGTIYNDGCQQKTSSAVLKICSFGNLKSTYRMVLFGDSHAGRMFPALEAVAKANNIRLDTYIKSGCESVDADSRWPGVSTNTCTSWRKDAIASLTKNPPNLIVLVNHLGMPADNPSVVGNQWEQGIEHSIERLPASSTIVMMADTPQFVSAPFACLSTHLGDANSCAGPVSEVFNPVVQKAEKSVTSNGRAHLLDLTPYLCNSTQCPAVIGSTLVYSDEQHMTATFAKQLGTPVGRLLAPYLPAAPQ